jgi:DNA-binding transcriptional ArsR family regulator
MANREAQVTELFYALADPTRRAVLQLLGQGEESVTALAAPFDMALPSFMKHVDVLQRCGLIRTRKLGRVRRCALVPRALAPAEHWLAEQHATWEARSDRMAAFAEALHQQENPHEPSPRP